MNTMSDQDLSEEKLRRLWVANHKNGETGAVARGNNGKTTILKEPLDTERATNVTRHLVMHVMVMR